MLVVRPQELAEAPTLGRSIRLRMAPSTLEAWRASMEVVRRADQMEWAVRRVVIRLILSSGLKRRGKIYV